MNLQHLEEKVASAEERALQLSLTGVLRFETSELAEAWQNINELNAHLNQHSCDQSHRLIMRLASVKAELSGLEIRMVDLGKGALSPVAA